jgi:uncharacterized protein YutE (UPF0331/DUF86 family)
MYDLERIEIVLRDIEKYLTKLGSFGIKKVSDLEDDKNFYSSSMLIFNIINRSIDLAEQIVRDKSLGTPLEYKEFFEILNGAKVINKKTSENMQDLVRKRNKISHRYGNITRKEIFDSIKQIETVKDFIKEIEGAIKNDK